MLAADLDVRAELMTPGRGARRPGRWRSSARSTATRCGSSPSATGPASSAAAPTPSGPASSAWSRSSARSSIGAGVRRVEALVGVDAYSFLAREHALVAQLTEALKVRPEELPDRIAAMTARLREVEKDLERVRSAQVLAAAGALAAAPARRLRGRRRDPPGARRHRRRRPAPARARRARPDPGRPAGVVAVRRGGQRPARRRRRRQRQGPRVGRQGRRAGARRGRQVLGGGGGGKDDVAQGGGIGPDAGRRGAAPASSTPSASASPAAPDRAHRGVRVRLGVDVGSVRVGVAACDPAGLLATPVETLRRGRGDLDAPGRPGRRAGGGRGLVGLPTSLSGRAGPAAAPRRPYAERARRPARAGAGAAGRRAVHHGRRPARAAGGRGRHAQGS